MHHRPTRPSLLAHLVGAVAAGRFALRSAVGRVPSPRLGRMALGALVTTSVVALVLAVPVISGADDGSTRVQLDAAGTSAASSSAHSPVVMGVDGRGTQPEDGGGTAPGAGSAPAAPATDPAAPAVPSSPDGAAPPAPPGAADRAAPSPRQSAGSSPATGSAPATGAAPAVPPAVGPAPQGPITEAGNPVPPADPPDDDTSVAQADPPAADQVTAPDSAAGQATATDSPATGPAAPDSPATARAAVTPAGDPAARVLGLVEVERTAAGCAGLLAETTLTAAAEAHSTAMLESGVPTLDGLDVPGAGAAVVAGGPTDASTAVAGWLADPTARAALLDCGWTAAGVGVVDGWWTIVLR